jgi:hypothetical protein
MAKFLQTFGIHPLSAFALITIDLMLFGNDALLGPAGWTISSIMGLILVIPIYLLQRYGYKDTTPIALAKALLLGLITAIPTPLPSLLTGASGLLGIAGTLKTHLDTQNKSLPTSTHPTQKPSPDKPRYDAS